MADASNQTPLLGPTHTGVVVAAASNNVNASSVAQHGYSCSLLSTATIYDRNEIRPQDDVVTIFGIPNLPGNAVATPLPPDIRDCVLKMISETIEHGKGTRRVLRLRDFNLDSLNPHRNVEINVQCEGMNTFTITFTRGARVGPVLVTTVGWYFEESNNGYVPYSKEEMMRLEFALLEGKPTVTLEEFKEVDIKGGINPRATYMETFKKSEKKVLRTGPEIVKITISERVWVMEPAIPIKSTLRVPIQDVGHLFENRERLPIASVLSFQLPMLYEKYFELRKATIASTTTDSSETKPFVLKTQHLNRLIPSDPINTSVNEAFVYLTGLDATVLSSFLQYPSSTKTFSELRLLTKGSTDRVFVVTDNLDSAIESKCVIKEDGSGEELVHVIVARALLRGTGVSEQEGHRWHITQPDYLYPEYVLKFSKRQN